MKIPLSDKTERVVDLLTRALIKYIKSKQRERETGGDLNLTFYSLQVYIFSWAVTLKSQLDQSRVTQLTTSMTSNLNQSFFVYYSQHTQSNKRTKNLSNILRRPIITTQGSDCPLICIATNVELQHNIDKFDDNQ